MTRPLLERSAHRRRSAYPHLMDSYGPVMTPREVATVLGISVRTIYNRGDSLPVASFHVGRRRRYRTAEVAAFLDAGGER